jgi:hypothetical protein
LQELLAAVPQQGRVRWIGVRPAARAEMLELQAVEARREAGLTGDHSRPVQRPLWIQRTCSQYTP